MATKIEKKIVGYALVNEQDKKDAEVKAAELEAHKAATKVVQMTPTVAPSHGAQAALMALYAAKL